MRKIFRLSVFIFFLSFFVSLPELSADAQLPVPDLFSSPEPTISMDFKDANLKDILKVFSIQSGLNFIASEAVQDRVVTIYLDKVSLQDAMDKLFKANNLSYELDRDSNIFIVKDWGRPQIETITKVFYLKYATVSSSSLKEEMKQLTERTAIGAGAGAAAGAAAGATGAAQSGKWTAEQESGITKAVKKILSESGSLVEDFRTNSLTITDIPSRMPIIAQTIASLDVPVPQVMLEVEMLDVSKNKVDKMGFYWGNASSYSIKVVSALRGTSFPLSMRNPSDSRVDNYFTPGEVSFPTPLQLILDFLRTQTDTRYLARPRLITLNNETAEIKIVTQECVGIKTTTSASGGMTTQTVEPERVETGVSLRVTPQVNMENGEITMVIYPQVSEATLGSKFTQEGQTYQYRDPEIRSTKSVVRIKDGETVIIGGLIRNEFLQTTTKIPILGDIPLLGALFRHKGGGASSSDKDKERELLVFITPRILKDTNIELAQAKKVVPFLEREQNTVSGVSRQLAINASLNSFEKKNR